MKAFSALVTTVALIALTTSASGRPVSSTRAVASQAGASPLRTRGMWAQDYAGRPADPAVRFGRLPNGLRYAIQHNDTPAGAVSMRMLIGSGSLSEREEERGLAHYLEHMAFRGSANIADGEVVRMLQRQGLQFGADTNAGTNFDQTVYQFDFPKADATAIDTGLKLFREIGGRLKIDAAAVSAERGVILSEERLRASGNLKAAEAQTRLTLAGTRVADRFPIGTIDSINAATSVRIRRFYEANYRPENATIVIIGTIDPVAIEAQIKQQFGDWRGSGVADPHPIPSPVSGPTTVKTFVAPGVTDLVALDWTRPLDMRADTLAREQERLLGLVGLTVLNLRLRERAQAPAAPFSVAGAQLSDVSNVAEQTAITVVPAPGRWRDAIGAVAAEQRRLLRDGISPADLTRTLSLLRPVFKAAADASSTRTDASIANALVKSAADDEVFTSPGQDIATFDRIAASLTPADVTKAYHAVFAGAGPFVFRSSTDAASGDDAALSATAIQAFHAPLAASTETAAVTWPYTSFGVPGRVSDRSAPDAAGITTLRFANGTRLSVKPTTFVAGGVSVQVSFGRGIVGLRPDQARSKWLLEFGAPAWQQGGTTKLTSLQMQRALEGHNVNIALAADDTVFTLAGETRKAELAFQTQLLAAYYSDAAYRPDGVTRLKGLIGAQLASIDSNTLAVFSRALGPLTHNGDARWKPLPDDADVAATTPDDLAPLLRDATSTPVDIVMVGDVTVDEAIAAVAPTFAALPSAPHSRAGLYTTAVKPVAAREQPYTAEHGGRPDQAVVVQLWPTPDYFASPADSFALQVAHALLSDRLVDTIREKLGLTYSPFVAAVEDVDLPGQGYLYAGIEVPPSKFDQFRQLLIDELKELATKPIDADALTRAKAPIVATRRKALETNSYWVARTARLLRDPRASIIYRDEIAGIERVTAADVQRVLRKYVVGQRAVSIEVKPKA